MSNIYLIGPRACGKTTVGRLLAEQLNRRFYDSDALIVEKAGCEISEYVEKNSWEAFRDLEAEILALLSGNDDSIVSCGGGIVVREENLSVLKNGFTVYLKTEVDVLSARLSADPANGQRPSLTGKSLVEEISEVLDAREALYSGCATLIVNGSGAVDEVCAKIMDGYKSFDQGDI